MLDKANSELPPPEQLPWNKGKLTGAKPPLRNSMSGLSELSSRSISESAIWPCSIWPSTANCEAATSSRSRSTTLVRMAIVRIVQLCARKKTKRPVRFELTEQTRQAVDDYIRVASKKAGEFIFTACRGSIKIGDRGGIITKGTKLNVPLD